MDKLSVLDYQKLFAIIGAILAFTGVAAGAFGAHLLRSMISPQALSIFEIGVRYQMYHAFGLFAAAWVLGLFPGTLILASGWLFISGTVIFSGSLYALALTDIKLLGAITPIGGVLMLIGWLCFIIGLIVK